MNGEIFTKSDLEQRQVAALRQKGQQIDLKSDPTNQQLRKALDEITPQIMVEAVDEMLMVQRGKELGYKLSDEQFKGVLDNIKKENKIENEEQFQAALKAENMTHGRSAPEPRALDDRAAGAAERGDRQDRRLRGRGAQVLRLAPQRIHDAADRSRCARFWSPCRPTRKALNVAADEAAKTKAEEIRARVTKGGEKFEKLAAEISDAPSKANAGLIGPISLNDLVARAAEDDRSDEAGRGQQPVRDGARLSDATSSRRLTTAQTMPFEQAREQIGERVFTDKRKAEFQKYLEKLRAQAIIEWKNRT